MFASVNESYILELASFVIVLGIIAWKVAPAVRPRLDARQEQIRSSIAAGVEARTDGEALRVHAQALLDTAREDAETIASQAATVAERLRVEGETDADEEYRRALARAAAEVELARKRASDDVLVTLGGIVVDATRQIVVAELDDSLHRSLIEETIVAAEGAAA